MEPKSSKDICVCYTCFCVGVQVGVYSGVGAHTEARGLYVVLQGKATLLLETGSLVGLGLLLHR